MKAMVVRAPGGTDVLKIEQVPDPTPGPKDVVIKVDACGVCFHDIVTRNGTLKYGVQMPLILGHEISGTVVAVGRDVRGFKQDDRVATAQRYHICGACKYCRSGREPLCPDRKFTGDWGVVGRLAPGESALVTGAGGGLGMHAVQLARSAGAYVVAQTTSPAKAEQIRALGAHEVIVHERGEDFSAAVKKATGGQGVDVAIDNVGSQLF